MLAAPHRLRRSDDFRRTMRRGSRSSRRTLAVHALADPASAAAAHQKNAPAVAQEPTRVGFVVSRAVGGAVVRNRVVRRLRHQMSDRLAQFEPGTMVVVRANPPAADASSSTLGDDLDACLAALRARRSPAVAQRGRP